jgi:hypothetical protein
MRGEDLQQGAVFSSIGAEQRVPQKHPLRAIRGMVDEALRRMSGHFDRLYARGGRPGKAERLESSDQFPPVSQETCPG